MRTLFSTGLVLVLSVALIGIPANAMPASPASVPLGVILQADRAQGGADIASGGATVYEGDLLETQGGETLRARLGGSQVYLRQSTAAEVHGIANGFSASLMRGSVVLSSPEGKTFRLLANGAIIRPAGTQPTVAQVTLVNANELLLTSNSGAIEISMGDEVKTIEPGGSYRMETQPEDPGPQGSGGPFHTARNRFILFAIVGVSAATAVGIWRALESPDSPSGM